MTPHTTARVVTLTQVTDSGASDNIYNSGSITSAVAVVAVNDAPTDLAISNTTFGQSLGSNGIVGILSATDVDSTTFTYSLVSGVGSTDNALFTLSGNTLQAGQGHDHSSRNLFQSCSGFRLASRLIKKW